MDLSFGQMVKLLPLSTKKLDELTLNDLKLVGTTLGIQVEITPELKEAAYKILAGENIHSVADLIQSPESIQQLITFIHGGISALAPTTAIDGDGWALNVEDLQL